LNGDSHLVDVQSTYIRTPHLLDMMQGPAWAIDCINLRCCGLMFANDARVEQQDCSMLDWTSAANGALLLRPEAR